jgi:hypothetical protein
MSTDPEDTSQSQVADVAAAVLAPTDVCSECKGPTPWNETDPHADEANGDICSECGHFYGAPAYDTGNSSFELETRLLSYCFDYDWEKAAKRVAYAPQEADFCGYRNQNALHWAVYNKGPLALIQAMSDASDFIGNPLWIAISRAISEREYEIVKCMVAADNHILRSVPSEGSMESILGHFSSRFKSILVKAVSRPPSESMEQVLQYSNEDSGESLPCRKNRPLLSSFRIDRPGGLSWSRPCRRRRNCISPSCLRRMPRPIPPTSRGILVACIALLSWAAHVL